MFWVVFFIFRGGRGKKDDFFSVFVAVVVFPVVEG